MWPLGPIRAWLDRREARRQALLIAPQVGQVWEDRSGSRYLIYMVSGDRVGWKTQRRPGYLPIRTKESLVSWKERVDSQGMLLVREETW